MTRAAIGLLAALAGGCAASMPRADQAVAARIKAADALAGIGCYRCLQQAFAAYDTAAGSPGAPADLQQRLFTTALLLAAREKELGLEANTWLDRARAAASATDAVTYLDIVSSVPRENIGAPDFDEPGRPNPATLAAWVAFLERPSNTALDRYLRLTVGCVFQRWGMNGLPERIGAAAYENEPAFVRYRLGLCGSNLREHLEAVLTTYPEFVEAAFFLGRYASADYTADRLTRALPYLTRAREAFPDAPLVVTTLANVQRGRFELERALELYDHALEVRPFHRDALLGRVITLTSLGRAQEAIDTASRLLDLGTWHIGDAYYWRAWNEYQTQNLPDAAADVARAKKLLINSDVLTLSGMVAYDQKRRIEARTDFEAARDISPGNCTASWYLGFIDVDENHWSSAAQMFIFASACYRDAAKEFQAEAAALSQDLTANARSYLQADYARRIADSLRQEAESAFNAAQALVRMGERARAAEQARLAAQHEEMKEKAESLLKVLEKN